MATTRKVMGNRHAIGQAPRIKIKLEGSRFRARIVKPPTKRSPSRMRVLCLRTHRQYREWPTRQEASAILRRGFDALARYQRLGLLRSVRVYQHDPQRHFVLFHPTDIEELAGKLRKQDAAREKKRKALLKLAMIAR